MSTPGGSLMARAMVGSAAAEGRLRAFSAMTLIHVVILSVIAASNHEPTRLCRIGWAAIRQAVFPTRMASLQALGQRLRGLWRHDEILMSSRPRSALARCLSMGENTMCLGATGHHSGQGETTSCVGQGKTSASGLRAHPRLSATMTHPLGGDIDPSRQAPGHDAPVFSRNSTTCRP